jgi:Peptidase C10 family/Secretion system C-terminal sorting domain/Leucine Rich Repeat
MRTAGKAYNKTGKIVLVTVISILFCSSTLAADIDSTGSRTIAQDFFSRKYGTLQESFTAINLVHKAEFHDTVNQIRDMAYYVWQMDQAGYVAVSAWNFGRQILFYSEGDFHASEKIDAFQYWLDFYVDYILEKYDLPEYKEVQSSKKAAAEAEHTEPLPSFVNPLIKTNWNQGCHYNESCPPDSAGPCDHTWAGCVAVAMAQIINYYQYPLLGKGSNSYFHDQYGELFADFTEGYDYALFPDYLDSPNPDLARFIYHCGVAVNMYYGPGTSGAGSPFNALIDHFSYSESMEYIYKRNYSSEDWEKRLKENLSDGKPVYYVGWREEEGHAFVCDGYDESGLFHFNLGWGGAANGFFSLEDLQFSTNQEALINISPPYSGPSNPQDSLALVALYNATNGSSWMDQENWLTGNVSEWFGIEVEDGRVTSIALPDNLLEGSIPMQLWSIEELKTLNLRYNKLSGFLPPEIGNIDHLEHLLLSHNEFKGAVPAELEHLRSLRNLYLNHNEFSSFPDLSSLPYLDRLYLFNNRLEFDDIEPNTGFAGSFLYSSQATLGREQELELSKGSDHSLFAVCGGSYNLYQWFRDNQPVEGANDPELILKDLGQSDASVYHCEIKNSLATDLTLRTAPVIITVTLPADWVLEASEYEYSSQIVTRIEINGQPRSSGWVSAYFEDEPRGAAESVFYSESGQDLFMLTCFGQTSSGESYNFKFYDPVADSIYLMEEKLFLTPGSISGTPYEPVLLRNKNHAPLLVLPVSDRVYHEYFGSASIDLSGVFTDPEGDSQILSASSSNDSVIQVSLNTSRLIIREAGLGSSLITVKATDYRDNSLSTEDTFAITVLNVNDAPYVNQDIPDQHFERGFGVFHMDLSGIFGDRDGDLLSLSATSQNTGVALVSLNGSSLMLTETGAGTSTITITASDGILIVDESFKASISHGVSIEKWSAPNITPLIFPNPTSGLFRMQLAYGTDDPLFLEVLSSDGILIIQKVLEPTSQVLSSSFDLSDHPPGIYYLRLRNKEGSKVSKLVLY